MSSAAAAAAAAAAVATMSTAELRQWMQSKPKLSRTELPDEILQRFLDVNDGDQEKSQQQVQQFCKARGSESKGAANWFTYSSDSISSDAVQQLLSIGYVVRLGRDDNGAVVALFRSGAWDPSVVTFEEMVKYMNMCYDVLCADPDTRSGGLITMVDFKGFEMRHLGHWSMEATKKLAMIQEAYPVKLRTVNYFNTSSVFNALFDILKIFMKQSVKDLVRVHKNSQESLHKQIPPRLLPPEFGGSGPELQQLAADWRKTFEEQLPGQVALYKSVVYGE